MNNQARLNDIEEILEILYEKLGYFQKRLISTDSQSAKFDLKQQIKQEILPDIRLVLYLALQCNVSPQKLTGRMEQSILLSIKLLKILMSLMVSIIVSILRWTSHLTV